MSIFGIPKRVLNFRFLQKLKKRVCYDNAVNLEKSLKNMLLYFFSKKVVRKGVVVEKWTFFGGPKMSIFLATEWLQNGYSWLQLKNMQ